MQIFTGSTRSARQLAVGRVDGVTRAWCRILIQLNGRVDGWQQIIPTPETGQRC